MSEEVIGRPSLSTPIFKPSPRAPFRFSGQKIKYNEQVPLFVGVEIEVHVREKVWHHAEPKSIYKSCSYFKTEICLTCRELHSLVT